MSTAIAEWLFDASGLTAHGFCLLWEPGLITTYAVSDLAIASAYFSIPAALMVMAMRRRTMIRPLLWLFAAFILLCGATHVLDVITLWVPIYGLEAVVKAATAIVSVITAIALWRVLPLVLSLPSADEMRQTHAALLESREQLFHVQKMEAVGQLTGGVAHDFNNLLQVITGSLSLIERRIPHEGRKEVQRFIEAIRQASDTAARLTSRLLAFSRRQPLQPQPVEPDTLVRNIEEMIRRTLGSEIQLEFRLGDGRWNAICDSAQLEATLLNLCINSRDAMPNGGRLTVATADMTLAEKDLSEQEGRPGDYIEISVSDTGTGMTPDIANRVFEPFFTTKPAGQGTGLGLSQVYGFVKQSGGFVRLDSRPGAGTTVRIFLPAYERVISATAPNADVAQSIVKPTSLKILLVEDQDDVRHQIAQTLDGLGYRITEVCDGAAGLRSLQSGSFDLLITDVGLPELNGRQLAEAARALRPDMPIIITTGYAGNGFDPSEFSRPGIKLLRKPFALDELAACVRGLLVHPQPEPTQGEGR